MGGGEIDVVFGMGEGRFFAPFADDGIGVLVGTEGAGFVGEIGDVEEEIRLTGGGDFGEGLEPGDFLVDGADFRFDGGGVFALGFEAADLFGNGFALVLEFLPGGLGGAPGFIAGKDLIDELPVVPAAGFEALAHSLGIFPDDPDVEHVGRSFMEEERGRQGKPGGGAMA